MEIVLASRNKKKIKEMRDLLSSLCGDSISVLSLDDIGYEGDIEETGNSFFENALIKASVPASYGYIGVSDDSGLCVDHLDGAPGVYSARYAGEPCDNDKNNEKLLCALKDVEYEKRGASYVCCIALVVPEGTGVSVPETICDKTASSFASERCGRKAFALTATGNCSGHIIDEYRGEGGFGYDPLFYIDEKGKTFAEMTPDEKHSMSHRGRAMMKFAESVKLLKTE